MKNINVNELNQKIQNGESFNLIDVREVYEWEQANISKARNLPLSDRDAIFKFVENTNKDKEVYVICQAGGRSNAFANALEESGFTNVVNVLGGMNAWSLHNLPIAS